MTWSELSLGTFSFSCKVFLGSSYLEEHGVDYERTCLRNHHLCCKFSNSNCLDAVSAVSLCENGKGECKLVRQMCFSRRWFGFGVLIIYHSCVLSETRELSYFILIRTWTHLWMRSQMPSCAHGLSVPCCARMELVLCEFAWKQMHLVPLSLSLADKAILCCQ